MKTFLSYNSITAQMKPWLRDEYNVARMYGVRTVSFVKIYNNASVPEKGYCTHCSIGPKGGKYVHIITDAGRKIRRTFSSVHFNYDWNRDPPFELRNS